MKSIAVFISMIIVMFLSTGCDPERNPNGAYVASLKGNINNITESIGLGDTLKFTFQWPDILSTITPLGDTRTETVNSLQRAWFAFRVFRIDTVNRKVYSRDSTKVRDFLSEGTRVLATLAIVLHRTSKTIQNLTGVF
jgi:hypothetical protein